ncbi:uncharacterized protein E0L32_008074 [Thyridium curvatum]|uniref:AMP-dependent synthetase/ligase domain-containing protein n=1 Tax=Thyridium curvatum TaxID=1093900 RepID=A0A507AU67_9PEZI|nr:uncharacterized protein E0L32_008074 [Thyridium curvatum]TPX11037.1 hypothetical protein E0L32_008074 [Thyridium curvatum]
MSLAKIQAAVDKISAPPPPGSPYALPVPGTETEGRTAVYRHWRFRDRPLIDTYDPEIQSLHDHFEISVKTYPKKRFLGWRPWNPTTQAWENKFVWMSYSEVAERRKNLGAGIVELHHRVGATGQKYGVGLWSQNRPEWEITELALISQSLYPVSLYETLGPEASEYIINHAELTCVVASLPHIPALLKLAPRTPKLKMIISLDPLDAGEVEGYSKGALLTQLAKDAGIQIYSMTDVEAIGARSGRPMQPPRKDDVVTINYTSGTTGNPKGVVITHANAVAGVAAARATGQMFADDVNISYLPLAHIYGRMVDHAALSTGACIGYFHGDILGLVDDMKLLKPTGLFSVPRLFNRFHSAVRTATVEADGFKGALSRHVINAKKASMKLPPGQATNKHFLYDRIWTRKVLAGIGLDRCRVMISGSAQLDPDVHEFLRAAFANHFQQGFGMTETYATGFVQEIGDYTTGSIGGPSPGVEACIESCPDLDYNVTDKPRPRGELLLRGPIIFREYYKNPEENQKAIDAGGWFHTGDIVEVDEMGRFKIIDRKKNVLKLSQGEYISPERIENVYMGSSNLVAMAYVHGDGKESSLVGIFGVDPEHFAPFASKILGKPIAPGDRQAVKAAGQDPKVKKAFLQKLDAIGKAHKFNSYERVRGVFLDVEPFTIENELITPTLKLKRPQTARAFRKQIDEMYAEINAQPSAKAKL